MTNALGDLVWSTSRDTCEVRSIHVIRMKLLSLSIIYKSERKLYLPCLKEIETYKLLHDCGVGLLVMVYYQNNGLVHILILSTTYLLCSTFMKWCTFIRDSIIKLVNTCDYLVELLYILFS